MSTKTFTLSTCRTCRIQFQPADWLAYRVEGFCSERCLPYKVPKPKRAKRPSKQKPTLTLVHSKP